MPPFLDVPTLLERSQPRASSFRLWQGAGIFLIVVVVSTWLDSRGGETAQLMNAASLLLMFMLAGALGFISWLMVRKARGEQFYLESIEELIRLRRWPEAGMMLQQMLSQPTRTMSSRIQALIFLTGVLARYNRFEDTIAVQNYLLENIQLDGATSHGLRLARAMAMLREDHLFDADRAINELRRQVSRATRSEEETHQPVQSQSAGLALVEIYRDVKTGHPQEAIDLFNTVLPAMRDQLGHRIADAYMLIAKACDLLGKTDDAQAHFEKATLLAPAVELYRRYPETAGLAEKYRFAAAPQGAA